uniref:Uncharacterized protein n=1 Tax=Cacopsylla melanoneura TaxID=428564 RepID=A0A8D9ETG6_9HEMI
MLLTIFGLYIFKSIMFIKNYDSDKIRLKNEINNYTYNLRNNKTELYIPHTKTEKLSKSTFIAGAKMFNHLPKMLKEVESDTVFKIKLKEYLVGKSLYSMKEFWNKQQ